MSRTTGSLNRDHAQRRVELARAMGRVVLKPGGAGASLRSLAAAADTSVANLKHYFSDRDGAVTAALDAMRLEAAPHLSTAARPGVGGLRASLQQLLESIRAAWLQFGVGPVYAAGLAEGLSSTAIGPAFVEHLLEPLLQAGEARLRAHVERGELRPCDLRHAALVLLGPVVLALLHQDSLGGARCRPLDVQAFTRAHVERFLAAFPPERPTGRRR